MLNMANIHILIYSLMFWSFGLTASTLSICKDENLHANQPDQSPTPPSNKETPTVHPEHACHPVVTTAVYKNTGVSPCPEDCPNHDCLTWASNVTECLGLNDGQCHKVFRDVELIQVYEECLGHREEYHQEERELKCDAVGDDVILKNRCLKGDVFDSCDGFQAESSSFSLTHVWRPSSFVASSSASKSVTSFINSKSSSPVNAPSSSTQPPLTSFDASQTFDISTSSSQLRQAGGCQCTISSNVSRDYEITVLNLFDENSANGNAVMVVDTLVKNMVDKIEIPVQKKSFPSARWMHKVDSIVVRFYAHPLMYAKQIFTVKIIEGNNVTVICQDMTKEEATVETTSTESADQEIDISCSEDTTTDLDTAENKRKLLPQYSPFLAIPLCVAIFILVVNIVIAVRRRHRCCGPKLRQNTRKSPRLRFSIIRQSRMLAVDFLEMPPAPEANSRRSGRGSRAVSSHRVSHQHTGPLLPTPEVLRHHYMTSVPLPPQSPILIHPPSPCCSAPTTPTSSAQWRPELVLTEVQREGSGTPGSPSLPPWEWRLSHFPNCDSGY